MRPQVHNITQKSSLSLPAKSKTPDLALASILLIERLADRELKKTCHDTHCGLQRQVEKKMIKFIAVMLALLATSCSASFVEVDSYSDNCPSAVQLCLTKFKPGVGSFLYANANENWQEAYIGTTYTPNWNCQVALGAGREFYNGISGTRVGGWLWLGKGKNSAQLLFEDGKSGRWGRLEVKHQLTPRLTVGVAQKTYAGEAWLVEYKINQTSKLKLSSYNRGATELALQVSF